MGVSGSGKTTVGQALAAQLGWPFLEGDAFHPSANREKMRAGVPLIDADRAPWLDAIAGALADLDAAGRHAVLACSALRRAYRERLRASGAALRFVLLTGSEQVIAERMARRTGHYMPASLLPSQLALLEPPDGAEQALVADVARPPERIAADIVAHWGLGG